MIRRTFIWIVFLGIGYSSFGQIAQSATEIYTAQAKERIRSYYSALNLITGNKLENEEKTTVIYETIEKMFENDQVYITNDIDPGDSTPIVFKNKEYLENIRLFFSNSEVSFRIDSMKVSEIYKANNFYFIKAEVFREMTVSFNNQENKNAKDLDFYVKFVPGLFACQIYSIKNHEDNLSQFTKAKISAVTIKDDEKSNEFGSFSIETKPIGASIVLNETISHKFTPFAFTDYQVGNYHVKLELRNYNPVDTTIIVRPNELTKLSINMIPKIDSLAILKVNIKKQSRQQGFWGVTTLLMAGAGGYFLYESDQKYKEYQSSTSSNATDLRDTAELYDKIGPALLGVAGLCAIEFTIHSIKKGKANNNLRLYKSRNGITLSYKF